MKCSQVPAYTVQPVKVASPRARRAFREWLARAFVIMHILRTYSVDSNQQRALATKDASWANVHTAKMLPAMLLVHHVSRLHPRL